MPRRKCNLCYAACLEVFFGPCGHTSCLSCIVKKFRLSRSYERPLRCETCLARINTDILEETKKAVNCCCCGSQRANKYECGHLVCTVCTLEDSRYKDHYTCPVCLRKIDEATALGRLIRYREDHYKSSEDEEESSSDEERQELSSDEHYESESSSHDE